MKELRLQTDGAARGNPGPAGIGVVIRDDGDGVVERLAESIGEATNNVAEYRALLRGLERASHLGAARVRVQSDSELMVRQMRGQYRVKEPHLRQLHARATRLAASFSQFVIEYVPRERNREADRLANAGIDGRLNAGDAER